MPIEIVMPRLSDTMTEGTIARWLKKPGDHVAKGEALAEIETDKALMSFESFDEGTLGDVKVGDGQTVPLGEVIALLYRPGETPTSGRSGGAKTEADRAAAKQAQPAESAPPTTSPGASDQPQPPAESRPAAPAEAEQHGATDRVRASPLARRLAAQHGVDLTRIEGSGPNGRVVREDVEKGAAGRPAPVAAAAAPAMAAPAAAAAPAMSGEFRPFSRMEAVVARRMVESKTQVPHIYLTLSIDMAAALKFRADSNAYLGKENGLSVNDLFVKAVALTLRKHPEVNASYKENGIQFNGQVNIGFAVSVDRGLVVPVIRDADRKALPEIAAEARALAQKARAGGLAVADYEGGTFTTSNLGMLGVEEFDAVVNPPQAAILAIGAAVDEPVVKDGQIVPGKRCKVTLSCDHRVVYGWTAGEFLRDLKALMESPFGLVY
jgi:pyruvate dehydrogenase E2 component (dihydrolipoamide acetyltransferase)